MTKLKPSETVFTDFLIQYSTNILKRIESHDNREFRKKLIEKLLLKNLFLLRRINDPGFYKFICRQVLKDDKFLKLALQYVRKEVANKLMDSDFFYDPFGKLKDWEDINFPEFAPIIPLSEDFKRLNKFHEASKDFLEKQLKEAKIDGDLNKMRVLEVFNKEEITGLYSLRELLCDPFSKRPLTLNFIKKYESKLMKEHLNLLKNDFNNPFQFQSLIQPLKFNIYNGKLILKIHDIISEMLNRTSELQAGLSKFINGLISVIHLKWFDLKTVDDKWNILGKEYPFKKSIKEFKQFHKHLKKLSIKRKKANFPQDFEKIYRKLVEDVNKTNINKADTKLINKIRENTVTETSFLLFLIRKSEKVGYYNNAINGYTFLLELDSIPEFTFLCLNNIGHNYYKLMKYEKALNFYEKANQAIPSEYIYQKAIIQKNIANCYYFLDEIKLRDNSVKKVKALLNRMDDKEKLKTYFNLACAFEKYEKINKSQEYILKITSSDIDNDFIFDAAFEKFLLHENHSPTELEEYFLEEEIEKRRMNYILKKSSFQFKKAEKCLQRALKYARFYENEKWINLITEELAEFYILRKEKEKFIDLISNISVDIKIPKLELFQGVNYILNDENAKGITIFKKYYKNLFHFDDKEFLYNISPIYRKQQEIPLNIPPTIWFIEPLINFNVKNYNQLLTKLENSFDNEKDKGAFYWDLARLYYNYNQFEKAIKYYQLGNQYISDKNNKLITYLNLAGANADLDNFDEAEFYIDKGLTLLDEIKEGQDFKIQPLMDFLVGVSNIYELKFDFPKAIDIIEKAEQLDDLPYLKELKEKYRELNKEFFFYNSTDIPEVKNLLFSTTKVFERISENTFEFDYSLIIMGYCKSMEILLDRELTRNIDLSDVLKPYYSNPNNKWIKNEVWENLRSALKKILHHYNPKSISLGQWHYIFKDLNDKNKFKKSEPIYFEFLEQIDNLLEKNDEKIIKDVCKKLVDYRNPAAHIKYSTKQEFIEEKPVLISNINKILSLFN